MPKDHHFRIGVDASKWLWRYSALRGDADGWTEYSKRKVLIHDKLKGPSLLETEIHEGLHCTLGPVISESSVTQAAKDLSKILWRLGYRRLHSDELSG